MLLWRLQVKQRSCDEDPGGFPRWSDGKDQRKGGKGLSKCGITSRWNVEAETMDSGKVEVSQAGTLRLITSHPGVFTRADAQYMFG